MTGKFIAMSVWAMNTNGASFTFTAPNREPPEAAPPSCLAPVNPPKGPLPATMEVDARYGFSKERMVCGMGHG